MNSSKVTKIPLSIILTTILLAIFFPNLSDGTTLSRQSIRQTRTEKDVNCRLLLKVTDYEGREPAKSWECQLENSGNMARSGGGQFRKLVGLRDDWITQHEKDMVSGETHLTIPEADLYRQEVRISPKKDPVVKRIKKSNGDGNFNGFGIGNGNGSGIGNEKEKGRTQGSARNLEEEKVTKEVLVIKVLADDASAHGTEEQISDSIFGNNGDLVNLRTQYYSCSHGKLDFIPTQDDRTNKGVVSVKIDINVTEEKAINVQNAVEAAATNMLGNLTSQFDHVMMCFPPGTSGTWLAYAYTNSWLSVYNHQKCLYPSFQMHEVGHNLNLGHSGTTVEDTEFGDPEYGDNSGIMGGSYSQDDGPRMCFNGAKSWQLGWYSDRHVTVEPKLSGWDGILVGVADYDKVGACTDDCFVIIKIEAGLKDYYVAFNRRTRSNYGTYFGADKVLITHQGDGSSDSIRVGHLDSGEEHEIVNFNNTLDSVIIQVTHINVASEPGYAEVSVFLRGPPTMAPAPTPACIGYALFRCEITTDLYPQETSWTVVNDTGVVLEGGGFTERNALYVTEACLEFGSYVFTISDQYSDGMCCEFGNGGYSVTVDGEVIGSGGEFAKEDVFNFTITTPSPTPSPTPACVEGVSFRCEITTDHYPQETSWTLVDGTGVVLEGGGFTERNTLYVTEDCIPVGSYVFTISDQYSDGMCCEFGNGGYNVRVDGEVIGSGGEFAKEDVFNFTTTTPRPTPNPTTPFPTASPFANPTSSESKLHVFYDIADVSIRSGDRENKLYGSQTTLNLVDDTYTRKILLKFDLGQDIPSSTTSFSGKLRLYVSNVFSYPSRTIMVSQVEASPDWDESSVTWANFNSTASVERVGANKLILYKEDEDTWVEVEVSDLVAHKVADGGGMLVLMLEIVSGLGRGNKCIFVSREGNNTLAPKLEVTTISPIFDQKLTDDSYISSGVDANNNFGTDEKLSLGNNDTEQRALLKFDLGYQDQEGFFDSRVVQANLRLHAVSMGSDPFRYVAIRRLASDNVFDQESVTWANFKPAVAQTGPGFVLSYLDAGEWKDVDVTDLVVENGSSSALVLMLEITSYSSAGNNCILSSQEDVGFEPVLTVEREKISSVRVKPIADTYIANRNKAEINYGLNGSLKLKNSVGQRLAFLRFDLGQLVQSDITRALLLLHVASLGSEFSRNVTVSSLSDSTGTWEELSMTWANANPVVDQTGAMFVVTQDDLLKWVEVDVSDLVAWSGNGMLDLMLDISLEPPSGKTWCDFSSREIPDFSPELILTI